MLCIKKIINDRNCKGGGKGNRRCPWKNKLIAGKVLGKPKRFSCNFYSISFGLSLERQRQRLGRRGLGPPSAAAGWDKKGKLY